MGGPITVFEAGSYAGDARIGPVNAGDERILSYSIDLDTEVGLSIKSVDPRLVGVEIDKGIFITETLNRQETEYTLSGRGIRERTILIEHPIVTGWDLVVPSEPDEETDSFYRFEVDLPGGAGQGVSEASLSVAIERTVKQRTDLLGANEGFIQNYIDSDSVGGAIKTMLLGILERRTRINETVTERRNLENRRTSTVRDQDRIRRNMENLDEDTDLYRQYVQILTNQEQELGEIDRSVEALLEQERNQRAELESYVRGLQTI
jgi:hypothetical protein